MEVSNKISLLRIPFTNLNCLNYHLVRVGFMPLVIDDHSGICLRGSILKSYTSSFYLGANEGVGFVHTICAD